MSEISQRVGHHASPRTHVAHLPWRIAGIVSLALAMLVQVWLSGRLGAPGADAAVILDYLAIMVSFVLAITGIALLVLGRDAHPLVRDSD